MPPRLFRRISPKVAVLLRPAFALSATALMVAAAPANATEGALGRPISGTAVQSGIGVVSPEPIWIASFSQIYFDGSVGGNRQVPVAGKTSLGLDGQIAFTLATLMRTWGTSAGGWNFASSFTLPYMWTNVKASLGVGGHSASTSQRASNLFDISFAPIIAGYHFSENDHFAFSLNIWAPTGQYDPNSLANTGLNNWTFIPQVAYTKYVPSYGLEFDVVAGMQFYTRNNATGYQNAPLFTLDVMGLKKFANGLGVGLVVGTTQQLGHDSGATADRLGGFRGQDVALGPIVTYDTKIDGKLPLSVSARWVPTVSSTNRFKSTQTFMATGTLIF
ncbi:phenol degradation protein meta [Pandoraea communis]|uniref:Phenol degradation protein meta n=2 Tax=Pandoraea communis TaxID=2508297 RepID=A0A5E4SXY2_9BURK|nr:phenol degradation protein meta [Pandoraea communis]